MEKRDKHITHTELLIRFFAQETTSEERLGIEKWCDLSTENKKEFDAFEKLWNISDKAKDNDTIDLDYEWKHIDNLISANKGRVINFKRVLQIAATIIVVFGLSFLLVDQTQNISNKTSFAQVQTVNLPDGSTVTLNANSKIRYSKDFGKVNRELSLKGEAFFNVTKNSELPFVIDAQGATIRVVGTQFNVKARKDNNEIKVSVVEGVVQLFESKQPAKKTVLNAGEIGVYMKKGKAIKKYKRVDTNDISWKTMKISFENSTLLEVANILSHTYHIEIEVDDSVKDNTITVDFDNKDLVSVLKVLKSTLDLKITKKDDVIFISGK